jgi:hypothetical protein
MSKPKRFYNEKEWRYFPKKNITQVKNYDAEIDLEKIRKELNENLNGDNWVIQPEMIEYLIIKDAQDMKTLKPLLKATYQNDIYEDLLTKTSSSTLPGRVIFRMMNPKSPAKTDAINTAIFEWVIASASLNASRVMNIDMVNPIPAKNPTPNKSLFLMPSGKLHKPMATESNENVRIPTGFPKISPVKIPRLFVDTKPSAQLSGIAIPVLAKANSGNMTNATGRCKRCCNKYEGDFSPLPPKGMAKANKMPVMVAWMPE